MTSQEAGPAHGRWWHGIGGALGAGYVSLVAATARFEHELHPEAVAHLRGRGHALGAFWHGRLLLTPACWRALLQAAGRDAATPAWTLISRHGDGALIAAAVARLGIRAVRGSQARGGREAFWAMRTLLREGRSVAIALDGPRGPRMRAKRGILELARLTGELVLPVTWAIAPALRLASWDGFVVPAPFGRGRIVWGEPLEVPRAADRGEVERLRGVLEERLVTSTRAAERALGLEPVGPADAG